LPLQERRSVTAPPAVPLRIKEMTPGAIQQALARDPRLLVPVGTCEPHGAHLPLGCDTIVVERLTDELSAEFGILRAPTIEYGVNAEGRQAPAGNASLRRKTLRRALNDLLLDWERQGVGEFIIVTMHGHAPHQEALTTVVTEQARVRVIDILALDFSAVVAHGGPIHGGEVDTSLVLFVAPHLVDLPQARDFILPERAVQRYRRGTGMFLPPGAQGSVGAPTRASAETGQRLFELIKDRIRTRVLAPAAPNPTTATG
jgi:creatinine amidohydrolase